MWNVALSPKWHAADSVLRQFTLLRPRTFLHVCQWHLRPEMTSWRNKVMEKFASCSQYSKTASFSPFSYYFTSDHGAYGLNFVCCVWYVNLIIMALDCLWLWYSIGNLCLEKFVEPGVRLRYLTVLFWNSVMGGMVLNVGTLAEELVGLGCSVIFTSEI